MAQNALAERVNSVCMRLTTLGYKVDIKIAEELMKIMCQGDCISRAIDVRSFNQMYHTIVEHVQNRKRGFL